MSFRTLVNSLHISASDKLQLVNQFNRVNADLAALRASVVAITAKLDLDAGVTDVNYAATCNPAATTFVP